MAKHTSLPSKSTASLLGIPETISKAQSCDALGCSLQTLDRMINEGKLRVYKIGARKVRVSAEDVRSFFAKPANFRVID